MSEQIKKPSLLRAFLVPFLFWVEYFGFFFVSMFVMFGIGKYLGFALPIMDKVFAVLPFLALVVCAFRARSRAKRLKAAQGSSAGTLLASFAGATLPLGVLAMIAWPNFSRFQPKARQSEGKIALAALYGAEKKFREEKGTYSVNLKELGFEREGRTHYYSVGFAHACAEGGTTAAGDARTPMAYNQFATPEKALEVETYFRENKICRDRKEGFDAYAVGVIMKDGPLDVWKINEKKELVNMQNGTFKPSFWDRW